jgi:hypothetical protein
MTNKTVDLINDLENSESDFYAKLVPNLLKEVTNVRKQQQLVRSEHEKTKLDLTRIYKDYQASLNERYNLAKEVFHWKIATVVAVSVSLILLFAIFYLGAL